MVDADANEQDVLPAGAFSAWLRAVDAPLRSTGTSDVPCDGCTACCSSSQFVHIGPDEVDTLANVPAALLFPAPRMPLGHVLLGYDEHGRCPMLTPAGCSIYEHRPRTCRTYDCRVFPATGLLPGADKPLLEQRARRWRFDHPTAVDRIEHDAARAAAAYVQAHAGELVDGEAPATPTQLAVLALQALEAFLERDAATGSVRLADPSPADVRVVITRHRAAPERR